MEEHRCEVKYIFVETDAFRNSPSSKRLSQSERKRLYFDLMLGQGKPIKGLGGLKEVRSGPGGSHGRTRTGWEVVFAEYVYPDVRARIFALLVKFPVGIQTTLTPVQRRKLRGLKAMVDVYVDRHYYDKLKADDSIFL